MSDTAIPRVGQVWLVGTELWLVAEILPYGGVWIGLLDDLSILPPEQQKGLIDYYGRRQVAPRYFRVRGPEFLTETGRVVQTWSRKICISELRRQA